MGFVPIIAAQAAINATYASRHSRHSGPSWCQQNNCKCPCHRVTHWYESERFTFLAFMGCVVVFGWLFATIVTWPDSYEQPNITLVQVLAGQWHWLVSLAHRIY